MPFVSRELLRLSLERLKRRYSPLLTVSVPCMLAAEVPTSHSNQAAETEAKRFGSSDEKEWMNKYFRPGGGPTDKPYYMPGTGEWVEERYPDRALQRVRKITESTVFYHPNKATWAFRETPGKELKNWVLKDDAPVLLVALMAWMWRTRELTGTLSDSLDAFIKEMHLDRDDFIGTVYSKELPSEFVDAGLLQTPLSLEDVADLIGAAPPAPTLPPFGEIVDQLEGTLTAKHLLHIPGLVQRVLGGWLVGDIVVLVGPSGSGKSTLAIALADGLEEMVGPERIQRTFIEVGKELDTAEFIGYENLAGEFVAGRFTTQVLLAGEPTDMRFVILDEWNLSQIDSYLAPLLSVLETHRPFTLPGRVNVDKFSNIDEVRRSQPAIGAGECTLPEDTFIIATCNSWLDEPESRHPISGPVKRRCRIITMPNLLELRFSNGGEASLIEVFNSLIAQERDAVQRRSTAGRQSVWDKHRSGRLQNIADFSALEERTRTKLLQVCSVLLKNPHTKNTFTVGIVRDILLSCVYAAAAGEQFSALGEQVADKVMHQVVGAPSVLKTLLAISADFPNVTEIQELAERMGMSGTQSRIRPLV